jgi:hypothetical protein
VKTEDDVSGVATRGECIHEVAFALGIGEHREPVPLLLKLRERLGCNAFRVLLWICQILRTLSLLIKLPAKLLYRAKRKLANGGSRT